MRKIGLIMAIFAIISMGLVATLGAQQSNQNVATAEVFTTDVDDYMNVHSWEDVTFNKWFGYLGGNRSGDVNLGFATKISGIYLGAFYAGNILKSDTYERKEKRTTWDTDLQQLTEERTTKQYTRTTTDTDNHISAFVGIAGMGIRLGFMEDIRTYNAPFNAGRNDQSIVTDNQNGNITYSANDSISYEESYGSMIPYIQWGMKLKLGPGTLAPRVTVGVDFYKDILIDEYYAGGHTEYQGEFTGTKNITRRDDNYGYIGLDAGIGADYYLNDNFYIGLDYALGINFYGNSYKGAGKSGSVNGYVRATNTTTTSEYLDRTVKTESLALTATERSYMEHIITPSLWKTTTVGENIKLGLLLKVPVTIGSESSSYYNDTFQLTQTTYNDASRSSENTATFREQHTAGTKTEYSTFSLEPSLGIGASYNLVPDRFTVNGGVTLNPVTYTRTSRVVSGNGVNSTYEKTENGSGDNKYTVSETLDVTAPDTITDTVYYNSSWKGLNGSVAAGFVFGFFNNFTMDLLISNTGFDIGLTSMNILFTFKF